MKKNSDKDLEDFLDNFKNEDFIKTFQISDEEKKKFFKEIMKNYFLDNDNILFLKEQGVDLFSFNHDEKCICGSGKKFKECHFLKMAPERDENYKSYAESLAHKVDFVNFFKHQQKILNKEIEKSKKETCWFLECKNLVTENFLFNNEIYDETFVIKKDNILDKNYIFGEDFFEPFNRKKFAYYAFCEQHDKEINDLELKYDNESLILKFFANVAFNLYEANLIFKVYLKDFLDNYNSIQSESYKSIAVYSLRKKANNFRSLDKYYNELLLFLSEKTDSGFDFRVKIYETPGKEHFSVKSLVYPQLTPDDFEVLNPVNNPFVQEEIFFINSSIEQKNCFFYIVYDYNDTKIDKYLDQFNGMLHSTIDKQKYLTNTSLLLSNYILLDKVFFESLSNDDRILYSALTKFRLETPQVGDEFIKMKFFSSLTKGYNLL